MATPQIRRKKLKVRLGFDITASRDSTPTTSTFSRPSTPFMRSTPKPTAPAEPSIFDFTFEDYKAANLNIQEQQDLIGKIREEVPMIDRDEIDGLLLSEAAKQLEMCVFPMCKMMHIDPKAVKRMLDEQFRRAYGLEVEQEVMEHVGIGAILRDATATILVRENGNLEVDVGIDESRVFDARSQVTTEATPTVEPPKKKTKKAQPSSVQKEVKAYQAKKKRGKKKCYVMTLRFSAGTKKWAALESGS